MRPSKTRIAVTSVVAALGLGAPLASYADNAAVISNGTLILGINATGNLNIFSSDTLISGSAAYPASSGGGTSAVGLRFIPAAPPGGNASTEPGCVCEGWGAGIVGGVAGWANKDTGTPGGSSTNLQVVSFTTNGTTATSVVNILDVTGAPALQVRHTYAPLAGTPYLYQVTVGITNLTGSALGAGDLRYRRAMDWDIEPTAFSEFVTIQGVPAALGVANGNNVNGTSHDGFVPTNPFGPKNVVVPASLCAPNDANFTDCGPDDHGAMFDFEFEALAAGATREFQIFYGAAPTEAEADLARALVDGDPSDIEVGLYSYGQCNPSLSTACSITAGTPNTFIFGFGAAGGVLVPPPTGTPIPGTLALLGLGMGGLGLMRRRRG